MGTLQEASPREEETLQEAVGAVAETKTSREAGSTSVETAETQRVKSKMSLEPRPKMRQMMGSKTHLEPRPMMKLRMKLEMRRNTRLETRRKPTREFPQELSLHRSGNLTYHRPRDPTC